MIGNYIIYKEGKEVAYRTKRLISDYPSFKAERKQLNLRLEMGSNTAPEICVQHTLNTDGVLNEVIRQETILEKIRKYDNLIRLYDNAWEQLDEEQQYLLKHFYQTHDSKTRVLYNVQEKYGISRSKAYTVLREGLIKFQNLVFGRL